jgi:hypothetical protein
MIHRSSLSYRFLAPMLALGVAACSGAAGDASSLAPTAPNRIITSASVGDAGNGVPNQGELELCKTGDAGRFEVTDGVTTLSYDLAAGDCVVAWVDVRTGLDTARLTVTELPSTTSTFTSVTITTINNQYAPPPVNGAGPDLPTTTSVSTVSTQQVKLNEYIGSRLVYLNTLNQTGGCTYTQGWYKNHTTQWPAGFSPTASFDGWGTWIALYDTPPKGGNAYIQLAHQYMTALMNKASGAAVPADVQAALNAAEAYFAAGGTGTGSGDIAGVAAILDAYNNGVTGPGHCD